MERLNGNTNGVTVSPITPSLNNALLGKLPSTNNDTTPEPSGKVKLYQKILKVYEDVKYIQKDKRNAFHGYNYASEAAIKEKLHESFLANGLILLPPTVLSLEDTEPVTTVKEGGKESKGNFLTTVHVRFTIADTETGAEVYGETFGRGSDNSDKGIYKAITGALKYWLTTSFLIATGDDPEEQTQQPEAPKQPPRPPRQPRPAAEQRAAQGIDTGPHPVGTQEAANFVAAQKIAAGSATEPDPGQGWPNRGAMKTDFHDMRKKIGERAYGEALGKFGVKSCDEFKSSAKAIECFDVLRLVASAMTEVA